MSFDLAIDRAGILTSLVLSLPKRCLGRIIPKTGSCLCGESFNCVTRPTWQNFAACNITLPCARNRDGPSAMSADLQLLCSFSVAVDSYIASCLSPDLAWLYTHWTPQLRRARVQDQPSGDNKHEWDQKQDQSTSLICELSLLIRLVAHVH